MTQTPTSEYRVEYFDHSAIYRTARVQAEGVADVFARLPEDVGRVIDVRRNVPNPRWHETLRGAQEGWEKCM